MAELKLSIVSNSISTFLPWMWFVNVRVSFYQRPSSLHLTTIIFLMVLIGIRSSRFKKFALASLLHLQGDILRDFRAFRYSIEDLAFPPALSLAAPFFSNLVSRSNLSCASLVQSIQSFGKFVIDCIVHCSLTLSCYIIFCCLVLGSRSFFLPLLPTSVH